MNDSLAEGEGFEPSKTLPSYRFSRAARSTTPAPFLASYFSKSPSNSLQAG